MAAAALKRDQRDAALLRESIQEFPGPVAVYDEQDRLIACNALYRWVHGEAFERVEGDADVPLTQRQTSLKNLEWERIHETLVESDFNISETARRLGMHRRTLARKLEKRRLT